MAIISGSGVISDSADGNFFDASIEILKIGVPALNSAVMQGTVAGFSTGGRVPTGGNSNIEKFPFSISSGTSTDIADLIYARAYTSGQSSSDNGFNVGGQFYGSGYPGPFFTSFIEKFPFSISSGTGTEVGSLITPRLRSEGTSSPNNGFVTGGTTPSVAGLVLAIDTFPFTISSGTATDAGDLSIPMSATVEHASSDNGFLSGSAAPTVEPRGLSTIQKFPFVISGATGTDVGDLSIQKSAGYGQSSATDGFNSGGVSWNPSSPTNFDHTTQIDKFPFSISSGTSTDVGDLNLIMQLGSSQNSFVDGFMTGGAGQNGSPISDMQKFPFANAVSSTNVGDLIQSTTDNSGHQD